MEQLKTYVTHDEIIKALKEGKKLTPKNGGKNFRLEQGRIGDTSSRWVKVLYYWCNPQMNRTFAMLENGVHVDCVIDILDIRYSSFIEYVDAKDIPRKMTKIEIEKELGYKIHIV